MKTTDLRPPIQTTEEYSINQKLCLIEDIMKAERFMYAYGGKMPGGDEFDRLYDLSLDELSAEMKELELKINQTVKR